MPRSPNIQFLYQIILAIWTLTFVSMGLILVWTLINLQEPKNRKRPGINIKEIY
jgi:hypothetical protein